MPAGQIGDEVGPRVIGGQHLGAQAGGPEVALQVLDRGALVARRIDGVEAHQRRQQLDRLLLE